MNRTTRRRPLTASVAGATALVTVLNACSGDTDPGAESADDTGDENVAECQEPAPSGSFTWTDDAGKEFTVEPVPTTVVAQTSVAAGLWDAGYQVDGVYGETDTSAPGAAAQLGDVDLDQIEVIGSTYGEFDVDAYAQMQPDLLIDYVFTEAYWYVPSKQQRQIEKLAPIAGVAGQPADVDAAIETFVDLAGRLGADTECNGELDAAKTSYDEAAETLGASADELKVLFASGTADVFYAVNPDELPEARTLKELGVDVIGPKDTSGQVFGEYSWEEVGQFADADLILMDGRNTEEDRAAIESIPTWSSLPAVEAGQVSTWDAGAPYSWKSYAENFATIAGELGDAQDLRP